MTPNEVIAKCRDEKVEMIDLRFLDFIGLWQHFTIPVARLDEDLFKDGLNFDGSSIRAWQAINESDMKVMPDAATAFIDPFTVHKTMVMVCDVVDPITKMPYPRDPRSVAKKAMNYLKSTGIADMAYFGPEAEFFVFDDIRFDQTANSGYYYIDANDGRWNTGREEKPNLGYKPRYKEGYFPVPPTDVHQDLRTEMMLTLEQCGIKTEIHHHEVATGGQSEIGIQFAPLVEQGDNLMKFKYIIKMVARRNNKTVTFMPKPLFNDNGSGMHVHCSLWKGGKNLFYGDGYGDMSEMGLYAIGGVLKHARALNAITNPTTNSYKRLVPGFEAPVNLAYSARNRSAAVRLPITEGSKSKRFEFRCPDPSCNPYLAFAAILMAMIDGIQNKIHPGDPLDKDIYDLPKEELAKVPSTAGSLEQALDALQADHDFLMKGDVFTGDVLETWIDYKRGKEVDQMRLRPHPYEFALYYDI